MRLLANQKGIALVTSLMLTMISLVICMAMLYLMTQAVKVSASQKRYRTALEASYGGSDVVLKDVIPLVFQANSAEQIHDAFPGINLEFPSGVACLSAKLTKTASTWDSGYSQTLSAKSAPDMKFTLQATGAGAAPYSVYAKIVDTKEGNSDVSGLQLEGSGVVDSAPLVTPQHFPYVYRLEVQAESSAKASEQAKVSVLYAY
jgi:hypothetical protein